MLVLRLQRTGRRNVPAFRLVAAEKTAPVKGRVKEYLGHYLPTSNPHVFECNKERVAHWLSVGAQPSNTVARLLKSQGIEGIDRFIKSYTKKRKKKQTEEEAAAPPKEEKKEAPAEKKEVPQEEIKAPSEETKEEPPVEEEKKEE